MIKSSSISPLKTLVTSIYFSKSDATHNYGFCKNLGIIKTGCGLLGADVLIKASITILKESPSFLILEILITEKV